MLGVLGRGMGARRRACWGIRRGRTRPRPGRTTRESQEDREKTGRIYRVVSGPDFLGGFLGREEAMGDGEEGGQLVVLDDDAQYTTKHRLRPQTPG